MPLFSLAALLTLAWPAAASPPEPQEARPASATVSGVQERSLEGAPLRADLSERWSRLSFDEDPPAAAWDPLGPLPIDRAGAERGYILPSDGARVLQPGESRVGLYQGAANFINIEDSAPRKVYQNYEVHTGALTLRRGFEIESLPRFELGAQIEFHRFNRGFLDHFIEAVERGAASASSDDAAINHDRDDAHAAGYYVDRGGARLGEHDGSASGWGDLLLSAKAVLSEGGGWAPTVAARLAVNLALGKDQFSSGGFAGAGMSVEQRLFDWLVFHGDLHGAVPFERRDWHGLPLAPASFGAMLGLEARLGEDTSVGFQVEGNSSPYRDTGFRSFDSNFASFSLGLAHRTEFLGRQVLIQFWGRENFEVFPFKMGQSYDPDFSVGLMIEVPLEAARGQGLDKSRYADYPSRAWRADPLRDLP